MYIDFFLLYTFSTWHKVNRDIQDYFGLKKNTFAKKLFSGRPSLFCLFYMLSAFKSSLFSVNTLLKWQHFSLNLHFEQNKLSFDDFLRKNWQLESLRASQKIWSLKLHNCCNFKSRVLSKNVIGQQFTHMRTQFKMAP